jgi:hypothetical protein
MNRWLAVGAGFVAALSGCAASPAPSSRTNSFPIPTEMATTTQTPTVTASPTPAISPGPAADWFADIEGWTIVDSLPVAEDFERAANASVDGSGSARVQAAAEATHDEQGHRVDIVAFAVAPDPGHSEQDLFAAIMEGIRAGVGIEPVPVLDGWAFSLQMGEREVIIGPWKGGPYTVFLVTDGPSIGASREVYTALLD